MIESVPPEEIGAALQTLILHIRYSLRKDAGYFFFDEVKRALGNECYNEMKDMGADLDLLKLKHTVSELEKTL